MRTINQILMDGAKGNIPTHEECYFTMLALRSKLHLEHRTLMAIAEAHEKGKVTGIAVALRANDQESVMNEHMTFSKQTPTDWLGDSGIPFTEENKKWNDMADSIYKKFVKK